MKKMMFLSLAVVMVSFNVQAIPPPPPLPPAIGYLKANLKITVNVTDLKKCDGYLCEQQNQTCNLSIKIPVIPAGSYDEGYYPEISRSVDGTSSGVCEKIARGFKHWSSFGAYASLDSAANSIKIVSDTRAGKSAVDQSEYATDNSGRNVSVVSMLSPSVKIKNSVLAQVYKPFDKTKSKTSLSDTSVSVSTDLEISSLQLEPAN